EPGARGSIDVDNPATGETLGVVPKLGRDETRRAIDAAARAFPAWRRKTAKERAAVLRRWFDLMMANQEDLAKLMTLEQGKAMPRTRRRFTHGSARRPRESTATPFPVTRPTSASSSRRNPLASSPASRHGTSRSQ